MSIQAACGHFVSSPDQLVNLVTKDSYRSIKSAAYCPRCAAKLAQDMHVIIPTEENSNDTKYLQGCTVD